MFKQDDNIKIISSKLFVQLDTFLKESSKAGPRPTFHKMKNIQIHRHYHSALSPIFVHTTGYLKKTEFCQIEHLEILLPIGKKYL